MAISETKLPPQINGHSTD